MPPTWESAVSPAGRGLQAREASDLATLAKALPESWAVQLEPPYGQVSIGPFEERRRYVRCWVAARATMCIFKERWRAS